MPICLFVCHWLYFIIPLFYFWPHKFCVCVCESRLVLAKPYACTPHALALNSNVLASTHGYTSVILNRTKSKSSDFPPSFALCGPPLLPHTLTHWVAQKRIMARGRKLAWCTESIMKQWHLLHCLCFSVMLKLKCFQCFRFLSSAWYVTLP